MFPFPGPILALQSSYEQGYAAKSDQEGCAMDGGAGEAKEFDQCHGRS